MAKSWRYMDDNSLAAFQENDHVTRDAIVLRAYQDVGRPMTDREVKEFLGFTEMNAVRPIITRMMKEVPPRLEKSGDAKDHKTGKKVRLVRIAGPRRPDGMLFTGEDLRGVKKREEGL